MYRKTWLVALATVFVLSACGGGGSNSPPAPPPDSLTLSPTTLAFTSFVNSITPPSQVVNATVQTSASQVYLRVDVAGIGIQTVNNIVTTGTNTGQGTVVPLPPNAIGPGVHTATITVTACTSNPSCTSGLIGTPQTVNVTYTVFGVQEQNPIGPSFSINPTGASSSDTNFNVRAHPGFTASANANWFTVSPNSGGSGTTALNVSLISSVVDTFVSGTYTSSVSLTASSGGTRNIPVQLTVVRPRLNQIAPYVAISNATGTAILRGTNLESTNVSSIELAPVTSGPSVVANIVNRFSAQELEITYPALTAGEYNVRMRNALGTNVGVSVARLVVINPPAYPAGTIDYPTSANARRINSVVYDAERQSLYIAASYVGIDATNNQLLRYRYAAGWNAPTVVPYPHLDSLTLSTDGRTLIAASSPPPSGSGSNLVFTSLSPETLASGASATAVGATASEYISSMVVTNDNEIMAMTSSRCCTSGTYPLYRYTLGTTSIAPLVYPTGSSFAGYVNGVLAASGNGRQVLSGGAAGPAGDQRMWYYYSGQTAIPVGQGFLRTDAYAIRLDDRAQKILLSGSDANVRYLRVYDGAYTPRGTIPLTATDYALSADGSRAYTFDQDGLIHVYDTTGPISTAPLPEIGTGIGLKDQPGDLATTPNQKLHVMPGNRTVILVGPSRIVVQPLP